MKRFAVLLAILAGSAILVPSASASLGSKLDLTTGTSPDWVAAGDLNGDAINDLVTSNGGNEDISVFLNDGDRTFTTKTPFVVSGLAMAKIGKFNADPYADLVVSRTSSGAVILPGNNDGTFGTAIPVNVGTGHSYAIAVADFNGDQNQDFAVTKFLTGKVTVVLGNGDGTFGSPNDYTVGTSPRQVKARDLNGDGKPDLVVANRDSDDATVLLNNGSGGFGAGTTVPVGGGPTDLELADLNSDGKVDLVTPNTNSNNVTVRLGNGDGTFQNLTNYLAGQLPQGISVADFTADGKPDLAVANGTSGNVSVLPGSGTGAFGSPVDYATGSGATTLVAADLDLVTGPDLAVVNKGASTLSVLFNQSPIATIDQELHFGDQAVGRPSATKTMTITNSKGGDPMTVSFLGLGGTHQGDFHIESENCTAGPISFGSSCQVVVSFTPTATGARNAYVNVTYGGYENVVSKAIDGTGVEPVAPDTVIDSGPTGTITTDSATFTFSGTGGTDPVSKFQCSVDESAYTDCTSPHSLEDLDNGGHSLSVRAEDAYGLQDPTPASRTFTVKVAPPDTVIDSGPEGTIDTDSATFTFHGTSAGSTVAKILCKQDYGEWTECTSPMTYNGLADGLHTVKFKAVDAKGSEDKSPASRDFTVSTSSNERTAKISRVTVKGPAKIKRKKFATYNVRITNSGEAAATGVKVKVTGKGISLTRSSVAIPPDSTQIVKVKLKAKKPGKLALTFKVTSANGGTKTARKTVTVRR